MTDEKDPKNEDQPEEKDSPKKETPPKKPYELMEETVITPSSLDAAGKDGGEDSVQQEDEPTGMGFDAATEDYKPPGGTGPKKPPLKKNPGEFSDTDFSRPEEGQTIAEEYVPTIVPTTPISEKHPPSSKSSIPPVSYTPPGEGSESTPPSSRPPSSNFKPPTTLEGGPVREVSELEMIPEELRERIEDPQYRLHQYILSEEVGSGGMGSVWKAWDIKLSRWVAIKFLNLTDPESIIRFRREAKMTARLRHPNIAGVYEVNVTEGTHYLVMEFIEGKPFQKIECSVKEIAKTFVKVCEAIAYAHENDTVHRDIKPANILVNDSGEPFVTDFGLAKGMHSNTSLSITGSIMGTPAYMSPEQATGSLKEIDERSDVYSLGATLYTLVSKKAPFKADNPTALLFKVCSEEPDSIRSVNPQITQVLENIIFKAMSKKKEERYESATAFADDLQRYLGDEQVEAQKRKRIHKRIPTTVLAASIILVLGGLTVTAWNLGYLDAYIQPKGLGENPPTKPTPTEIAQKWLRTKFPQIKSAYSFREFEGKSPPHEEELRAILQEAPEEALNEIEGWFRSQQSLIPATLWDKSRWLRKKEEAKGINAWCLAVAALLTNQQPQFEAFQKSLEGDRVRFEPVIAYLGKISLKIYVWPYAEVRGLQVGETWFIRDGKRTEAEINLLGEKLSTPLVIENLDIGNIKLILSHPELGIQETTVSADKLENGKTFLFTGKLKDPGSLRIRMLP